VLLEAPSPTNESEFRGLIGGLVVLRGFEPRIAEKTLVLNSLTNSFSWEGLKHLLREMMKNPRT